MLPRSQSDLSAQFPELAKILKGKIREEDREKVSAEYEQLKKQNIDIIYPGHPDFPPQLLEHFTNSVCQRREKTSQVR